MGHLRFSLLISSSLLLLTATLISCSSMPQHQALRTVAVGMDKADVLEKVGNPAHISRVHNQDCWEYKGSAENGDEKTLVFFDAGRVTYVGPSEPANAANTNHKFKPLVAPPEKFKPIGE
jgi:hypothetical protein